MSDIRVDDLNGNQDPNTIRAPQPAPNDNSRRVATTSFVQALVQNTSVDFVYDHSTSFASTWVIPHNLNRFPNVSITDVSGNQVDADVAYLSPNLIQILFAAPFAGRAFLD